MRWRSWLAKCLLVVRAAGSWTRQLDHGSFRGFPTFREATSLLESFLETYPHCVRRQQIGDSYEHRPIYAYVLSAAAGALSAGRPQVLVTSLMHAREPAGLTVVLYLLGHLLELYSQQDPQAIYILERREVWFVPFINPDGYVANEKLTLRSMIRKNLRPSNCPYRTMSGVDINRNFAVAWKRGTYALCGEEYEGPAPFSEPETQALKKVCEENSFKAAINFHSFGSMLTHPWNYAKRDGARLPVEDDNRIYQELQSVFKFKKFGPAIETVEYTARGESDDWLYSARHIISMSPEVGPEKGGFFPPVSEIKGIDSRNYERSQYLLVKAGFEAAVEYRHTPAGLATWPRRISSSSTSHVAGSLRLMVQNKGMSESAGAALHMAVALRQVCSDCPPLDASLGPASSVWISAGGSEALERRPAKLAGAVALTFTAQPLPRRSNASLELLFAGSWPMEQPREAFFCASERVADPMKAVCQCVGPAALPALGSPEVATTVVGLDLRRFHLAERCQDSGALLPRLCAAAVEAASPCPGAQKTQTVNVSGINKVAQKPKTPGKTAPRWSPRTMTGSRTMDGVVGVAALLAAGSLFVVTARRRISAQAFGFSDPEDHEPTMGGACDEDRLPEPPKSRPRVRPEGIGAWCDGL